MKCSAKQPNVDECKIPVVWLIKAADKRMFACGMHLNRVCLQMLKTGVEYMTVTMNGE